MSQPFHIKYRPQTFDEVVGNETIVKSLNKILSRKDGKITTFMFVGPSGCGKTTFARIIANEMGVDDRSFHEYNASSTRGIDFVRHIEKVAKLASKTPRLFLLDECHMITNEGQEALLKLIEQPPKNVFFVLATTEPYKLKVTAKNRCAIYEVKPLRRKELVDLLQYVCDQEEIDFQIKYIRKIAQKAESPRQALVMLDSVIDMDEDDEKEILEILENRQSEDDPQVIELCRRLMNKASWKELSKIIQAIENSKSIEAEKIRYAILGYFKKVLYSKGDEFSCYVIEEFEQPIFYGGYATLARKIYDLSKK